MISDKFLVNTRTRLARHALTPTDNSHPRCNLCATFWDTWEEAEACHEEEELREMESNLFDAIKTGRIGGKYSCEICGITTHKREEAQVCCTPKWEDDMPWFHGTRHGLYFYITDRKKVADEFKRAGMPWLRRHRIPKSWYDKVVIEAEETIPARHAVRFADAMGRPANGIDYQGFFDTNIRRATMPKSFSQYNGGGHVGAELEEFGGGVGAKFPVAIHTSIKENGEWDTHTKWLTIKVFGRTKEYLQRNRLGKGDYVAFTGRLEFRKWKDKELVDVIANDVTIVMSENNEREPADAPEPGPSPQPVGSGSTTEDFPF